MRGVDPKRSTSQSVKGPGRLEGYDLAYRVVKELDHAIESDVVGLYGLTNDKRRKP